MTSERSRGKARTTRKRYSDLHLVQTEDAEQRRLRNHDALGRLRPGNDAGKQRGLKMTIGRMVGKLTREELGNAADADILKDAQRVYRETMATMPSDAAIVRSKVASVAWHTAMVGHWRARALRAGLGTKLGIECEERATAHDVRAERLMVTALDLAQRLPRPAPPAPPWWVTPTAPAPVRRAPVSSGDEDAAQGDDEGDGVSDDLDEPLERLRAVQGQRGALDPDDEDGEVTR